MYSACLKTNDTSSEQYVSSDPLLEEWDCISHASFDSSFCLDACELESFASLPQSLAEGTAVATETNVTCPLTTMCTPSSKTVMEDSSISDTLNSSVMSLESLNSPNLHESLPFLPSEVEYRHQWRSLEYVPSTPESLAPLSPCESSVDDLNDPLDFPNANAPRPCQKQLKRGHIDTPNSPGFKCGRNLKLSKLLHEPREGPSPKRVWTILKFFSFAHT